MLNCRKQFHRHQQPFRNILPDHGLGFLALDSGPNQKLTKNFRKTLGKKLQNLSKKKMLKI